MTTAKNLSNFVSLPWKLHNRYCHNVEDSHEIFVCSSIKGDIMPRWKIALYQGVCTFSRQNYNILQLLSRPWILRCLLSRLIHCCVFLAYKLKVLYFCVYFWELSHLTRDLSQAEKKINGVTSWETDKTKSIFTQNDNFGHFEWNRFHFVHLLSL